MSREPNSKLATILGHARRRLRGDEVADPVTGAGSVDTADPEPVDVVVALVRPDLDRFASALAKSLDPSMSPPHSPALLAAALETAIDRIGGQGKPSVTRSPAGLYTPEYWHVRIRGADALTRLALKQLASGGHLSERLN
jgi:hypothetical protein